MRRTVHFDTCGHQCPYLPNLYSSIGCASDSFWHQGRIYLCLQLPFLVRLADISEYSNFVHGNQIFKCASFFTSPNSNTPFQLNHPHTFCIPKLRRKFYTDIFFSRIATIGIDAHLDNSLNTAVLKTSNQQSFVIYPPYLHNILFLLPSF